MEVKKSPKANLENYSKVLLLLGLVFSLFVAYQGIEWTTVYKVANLEDASATEDDDEIIPITQQEILEVKPPPPPPPPAPEVIEVVEDEKEVEETVLDSTETEEEEEVETEVKEVKVAEIEEEEEEEEEVADVPFSIIENVPVFPGCTGSNSELKKCMSEKIQKMVNRKFNTELAQDLSLDPGRKKINVQFIVDKSGNITDIRARAPHPRLKKEAIRVIKLLPRMKPGKQRNKPVGVRYNLPIIFDVLDE